MFQIHTAHLLKQSRPTQPLSRWICRRYRLWLGTTSLNRHKTPNMTTGSDRGIMGRVGGRKRPFGCSNPEAKKEVNGSYYQSICSSNTGKLPNKKLQMEQNTIWTDIAIKKHLGCNNQENWRLQGKYDFLKLGVKKQESRWPKMWFWFNMLQNMVLLWRIMKTREDNLVAVSGNCEWKNQRQLSWSVRDSIQTFSTSKKNNVLKYKLSRHQDWTIAKLQEKKY